MEEEILFNFRQQKSTPKRRTNDGTRTHSLCLEYKYVGKQRTTIVLRWRIQLSILIIWNTDLNSKQRKIINYFYFKLDLQFDMSSGQDPPSSPGGSQQPRKGSFRPPPPRNSSFISTPKSAFRRPLPPRNTEQQFSQPSSTEPTGTGLLTSSKLPGPKARFSGVSFKSTTPTSLTTPKSIPAHSQKLGQVSLLIIWVFHVRSSMMKYRTIERIIQGRFLYQPKHHALQIYQVGLDYRIHFSTLR